MSGERPVLSRTRAGLYWSLIGVQGVLLVAVTGEIYVRLAVPRETLWPVSNIYHAVNAPGVGYTMRPDFEGTAFGVELRTNSPGFRGPQWARPKAPGSFRIALLGDSHAFAFGVPFQDSVGQRLVALLDGAGGARHEVLNFAVNGYNSRQELAVLRAYALQYAPDLLLVIASSNDHDPAPVADPDGWLLSGRPGDLSGEPMMDRSIRRLMPGGASWLLENSRLFLYLNLVRMRRELARTAQVQRPAPVAQDGTDRCRPDHQEQALAGPMRDEVVLPLQAMIHEARRRGIPLVLAHVSFLGAYRSLLEALGRQESVPVVDLVSTLSRTCRYEEIMTRYSLGWDSHLNAAAHAMWAAALAGAVRTRQGRPQDAARP